MTKQQLESSTQILLTKDNNNHSSNKQKVRLKIIVCAIISASLILIFIFPHFNYKRSQHYDQGSIFMNATENKRTHNHKAQVVQNLVNIKEGNTSMIKIDKTCKFLQRFTINGLQITYQGPPQKWTQLVGFKSIPYNVTYKIKLLISYTSNSHIIIGITNHQRIHQQSSFFNQDTYAYYGQNGCFWAQGRLIQKDSKGFYQKDIIQYDVKLSEGIIQWKVNGEIRGQVFSNNLKQQNKKYVPYLQMFQKQDSIRYIL